jgi:AraC-like DNA-binding protein
MADRRSRALYQRFLPDGCSRAFVWKYAQSTGGRRPRHFHGEPELNLVVSGAATFGIGDRVVRATRGDLLAFPTGQDHALLDGSPDLYLYAIGLDPRYSAHVLGAGSDVSASLHYRLDTSELANVEDRAAAIVDRSDAEQLGAELWERVHWLGRRAVDRASYRTHVLTRRALQLMAAEPELGLDALAGQLRTHPSEVSRHFHRDVGITLVRYRTRLRLLELVRLVDAGKDDLMSAASEAGFGSYSQCHRAFQAELGCAPRGFFASGIRERMQRAYDG